MSVPEVLSAVDAAPRLLDDHVNCCASFVETASAAAPTLGDGDAVATGVAAVCSPTMRRFNVQVKHELSGDERVGLVGDSKALGEWRLGGSVAMQRLDSSNEWTANVLLQPCRHLNYRYFIYAEDPEGHKHIRRWETHFKPRALSPCSSPCRQVDTFGLGANGELQSKRGWLTHAVIYQFKFERERMFQVLNIDKFDPEGLRIRIVPLQSGSGRPLDANAFAVNVEVAKMQYNQSELQPQQSEGVSHRRNDIVIFHVTVPQTLQPSFALEFTSADQRPIGRANIAQSKISGSQGDVVLEVKEPFTDSVLARLTLPYVVVRPFVDADILDFRTTYAHYWPRTWPVLDVGHRGNGKSYIANPPSEKENTVASFMRAYNQFADMIELDVHVTADGVPVIYHDFGLRTAPAGKQVTSESQLEYVLIKDLTYEALCQLRIFAVVNGEIKEYPAHDREPVAENRIFPLLAEVLEALPKTLGIDVEIKWPQQRKCGGVEAEQTIDKNFFVDRVLQTIIRKGCGRPLIFSSFDADICTMLRFKQNLFPVMFLTMGQTKKWEPFINLRTRTFEQALNNAQAFELAGTAPHAEDFMGSEGRSLMQKARQLGQIALVWGDDCNSREAVNYFREIGATATCYDRSDLYMPADKSGSFFNSSDMIHKFDGQCRW